MSDRTNYLVDIIECLCGIRGCVVEVKDDINRGITIHNYTRKADEYTELFTNHRESLKRFKAAYKDSDMVMEKEAVSYIGSIIDYFTYYINSLSSDSLALPTFNFIRDSINTMTLMINIRLNHSYKLLGGESLTKINA